MATSCDTIKNKFISKLTEDAKGHSMMCVVLTLTEYSRDQMEYLHEEEVNYDTGRLSEEIAIVLEI